MIEEIWKDIAGYEGLYQVSNLGNVRSLKYKGYDGVVRNLKQYIDSSKLGYKTVFLTRNKIRKQYRVHRLVAQAFIPNPNNYPEVNHKDENPSNNLLSNLEWCSRLYNVNYGTRTQRATEANINNPHYSKKVLQFDLNGNFIKEYESAHEVERQTGFCNSLVCKVCRGERNKTGGYIWKYKEE